MKTGLGFPPFDIAINGTAVVCGKDNFIITGASVATVETAIGLFSQRLHIISFGNRKRKSSLLSVLRRHYIFAVFKRFYSSLSCDFEDPWAFSVSYSSLLTVVSSVLHYDSETFSHLLQDLYFSHIALIILLNER